MNDVERLSANQAGTLLPHLIALLQDTVNDGASVGFLRPLSAEGASDYWREVIREVGEASRILLIAQGQGMLVGSVQLGLCTKPNALHRAEVQKLLVDTRWRRRGIGRQLMMALDEEAHLAGRTLLYLDTEPDQPAFEMYRRSGWLRAARSRTMHARRTGSCTVPYCSTAAYERERVRQTGRAGTCHGTRRLRSRACLACHSEAGSIATRKSD